MTESEVLARLAAQAIDDKKGMDISILDLRDLPSAPAAFFVIASGNVPSHVCAMSDNVHEVVKKATGIGPSKVEGYQNAEWILMDYFDVVVHIFQKDKRDFYRLDHLWADGKQIFTNNGKEQ
ncbi:MAG: ribosome silencing factor [Bacteroidales bacterium]|nr:ribosome silencing factor [Candidatus Colimorpha onthohippi]